jgi:hypothetical protein
MTSTKLRLIQLKHMTFTWHVVLVQKTRPAKTSERKPHGHSVNEVNIVVGRIGGEWCCEVAGNGSQLCPVLITFWRSDHLMFRDIYRRSYTRSRLARTLESSEARICLRFILFGPVIL